MSTTRRVVRRKECNVITAEQFNAPGAIFTESRRGMIHAESNPTAEDARIWIIVAPTDPVPPTATVRVLKGHDVGSARPGGGIRIKEVVGDSSPAKVHSDVRWLADVDVDDGATFTRGLADDEAVVLQPISGRVRAMGESLDTDDLLAVGPDDATRTLDLTGDGERARILVAVTGPGLGFAASAG
jgi:redox-sensitive bicupin YhaK (pirin superfamily)